MKGIDILIAPPVAFLVVVCLLTILYVAAGRISASGRKSKEKFSTYACGEDIPGFKFQFGYDLFFIFGLFFTIIHVTALVVATLPNSLYALFGLFYLGAIFLAVSGIISYEEADTALTKEKDD